MGGVCAVGEPAGGARPARRVPRPPRDGRAAGAAGLPGLRGPVPGTGPDRCVPHQGRAAGEPAGHRRAGLAGPRPAAGRAGGEAVCRAAGPSGRGRPLTRSRRRSGARCGPPGIATTAGRLPGGPGAVARRPWPRGPGVMGVGAEDTVGVPPVVGGSGPGAPRTLGHRGRRDRRRYDFRDMSPCPKAHPGARWRAGPRAARGGHRCPAGRGGEAGRRPGGHRGGGRLFGAPPSQRVPGRRARPSSSSAHRLARTATAVSTVPTASCSKSSPATP